MKKTAVLMGICLLLSITGCGVAGMPHVDFGRQGERAANYEAQMKEARTTPYGKYPELITYTLAKMTGKNNSNMPEKDTYEDNAYTRYLKETLNIQNKNVLEAVDAQYNTSISVMLASGELPDLFMVSDYEDLRMLVEQGILEDLTEAYDNCATEKIKDIYGSYGEEILEYVTFDGKLMALPETNIADGPNLLWLRLDWMEELGLKEPENLSDVEKIIQAFIEKNPGGNEPGQTVGLVCDTNLSGECGYSYEYLVDIIFAGYGAFPKQWIRNPQGEVVYGSVQPGVKDALAHMNLMYQEGILDREFLLRTTDNIIELIEAGRCGSFFGPWWAPNNPLMEACRSNPQAVWKPYLIPTDADGKTSYYSQNPSYKYVVVRKGYEYPEIAVKLISVMFDRIRYEEGENKDFAAYFQLNVDPTARPLAMNVDYSAALTLCYEKIVGALNGTIPLEDLELLEKAYYISCLEYLSNPENAGAENWAAYASRIQACALLTSDNLNRVDSLFFGKTDTMNAVGWKLSEMEKEAYLKIITGVEELAYFDVFVKDWYEQGGELITQEVRKALK